MPRRTSFRRRVIRRRRRTRAVRRMRRSIVPRPIREVYRTKVTINKSLYWRFGAQQCVHVVHWGNYTNVGSDPDVTTLGDIPEFVRIKDQF